MTSSSGWTENSGQIVIASPELQDYFWENVKFIHSASFAPQSLFWFLLLTLSYMLTRSILTKISFRSREAIESLKDKSRTNIMALHVMNVIICTLFLTSMIAALLLPGDLMQALSSGSITASSSDQVQKWDEPLLISQRAKAIAVYSGFGVLPLTVFYCIEILILENPALFIHHLGVFVLFSMGLYPTVFCLNLRYLQISWILSMHIAFEAPMFLNMLIYRLAANRKFAKIVMGLSVIYGVLLRFVVNSLAMVSYINFAWLQTWYSNWDILWRWTFPLLWIILFTVQLYIVRIYYQIYKHKFKDAGAPVAAQQKEEPSVSREADGVLELQVEEVHLQNSTQVREHASEDQKIMEVKQEADAQNSKRKKKSYSKSLPQIALGLFISTVMIILGVILYTSPFTCSACEIQKQTVVIIGGGAAGMSAAYALASASPNYEITIIEKMPFLGGAAYSVSESSDYFNGSTYNNDLGFKFIQEEQYQSFYALLKSLGFLDEEIYEDTASGASISYLNTSDQSKRFYSSIESLAPNEEDINEERIRFKSMLKNAQKYLTEKEMMTMTVGDFVSQGNLSDFFIHVYLQTCMKLYVGTGAGFLNTSLAVMIHFEKTFQGCTAGTNINVRYVANGTRTYIDRLSQVLLSKGVKIVFNTQVTSMKDSSSRKPRIVLNSTNELEADHIILAMRSEHLIQLMQNTPEDSKSFEVPRQLFNEEKIHMGELHAVGISNPIAHPISKIFPADRLNSATIGNQTCSLLQFFNVFFNGSSFADNTSWAGTFMFSEFDASTCINVSQTWPYVYYPNSIEKAYEVVDRFGINRSEIMSWNHTAHTPEFMLAGRNMHKAQGVNGVWYAGAEILSINLHESAVLSGLVIANALGARFPFESNAPARMRFLAAKNWMMYGINPYVPPLTTKAS
jgi:predicted NAD/FAD-binding protein